MALNGLTLRSRQWLSSIVANSKRCCKFCKEYHLVDTCVKVPVGWFCCFDHAIEFANKKQDEAQKKATIKQHKADKLRVKTKAEWLAELQAAFNKYVRLRDRNDGCISCDKSANWQGQFHAGHYCSRGSSSALRFNLWNVHKQCSVCNNHLSGNIGEYTPRLIEKIGEKKYNWLVTHKSDKASFSIEWIQRAIQLTKRKVKLINKK